MATRRVEVPGSEKKALRNARVVGERPKEEEIVVTIRVRRRKALPKRVTGNLTSREYGEQDREGTLRPQLGARWRCPEERARLGLPIRGSDVGAGREGGVVARIGNEFTRQGGPRRIGSRRRGHARQRGRRRSRAWCALL